MLKKNIQYFVILFCLFASFSLCAANDTLNITNPKAAFNKNWVSNPDNILSDSAVKVINNKLNSLYDSTTCQIVVVAIKGDKSSDAREISLSLAKKWQPGEKDKNNGIILLVCTNARQAFIQTGYGVESVITDAFCNRIITQYMGGHFKKAQWDEGMIAGVNALCNAITKNYDVQGNRIENSNTLSLGNIVRAYLIIGLLVFIICIILLNKSIKGIDKLNRSKKLNTFKAKYKKLSLASALFTWWLLPIFRFLYKKTYNDIRKEKIKCTCGDNMRLLSEEEEDRYLTNTQQLEETLGTRDYDVWLCEKCDRMIIYSYEESDTYEECPKCHAKAYSKISEQIIYTYLKGEILRKTYRCKACSHTGHKDIPINHSSSFISSSAMGGAILGSSIGRGFSSGGFSGGSFGGGSFGGGGGGGSW